MKDLPEALEDCSPEQRQLIELLLKKQGLSDQLASALGVAQTHSAGHERPSVRQAKLADGKKDETSRTYNSINEQLDSSIFGQSAQFMNFGYVANENPQYSKIELHKNLFDRNSVKLILEVVGDLDISGLEILDVGCGRGGTISVTNKYFEVKRAVGIDLSIAAVDFCNRNYDHANARFISADAEYLPFKDTCFDVVINIESSHCYPNILGFYEEVFRILKTNGYFLYADLFLLADEVGRHLQLLRRLGFLIERDQDIRTNVLASCDETAPRRLAIFAKEDDRQFIANFLGVPGTAFYKDLKAERAAYRMFTLRKPQ